MTTSVSDFDWWLYDTAPYVELGAGTEFDFFMFDNTPVISEDQSAGNPISGPTARRRAWEF